MSWRAKCWGRNKRGGVISVGVGISVGAAISFKYKSYSIQAHRRPKAGEGHNKRGVVSVRAQQPQRLFRVLKYPPLAPSTPWTTTVRGDPSQCALPLPLLAKVPPDALGANDNVSATVR